MRVLQPGIIALALLVAIPFGAASAADGSKQRIAITSTGVATPNGQFVFAPLDAGTLKRDSGSDSSVFTRRVAMRDGQRIEIESAVTTSTGRRGTFVTRHRVEWVDLGSGYEVGHGTWTFVRGTGQYARVAGRGRSAWLYRKNGPWRGRLEGFLTLP